MNPRDEDLIAAWNADVAKHGDSAPLRGETGLDFWMAAASTTTDGERRALGFWQPGDERRIEIVRGLLGGWDAVWRAVLKDEGFEEAVPDRRWDWYSDENDDEWILFVRRRPDGVPGHEWRLEGGGWSVPLRSPADLRVRVAAARTLFGEGT